MHLNKNHTWVKGKTILIIRKPFHEQYILKIFKKLRAMSAAFL